VTIGYSFAVSLSEVSFAEYELYCRATRTACPTNPWGSPDYPVVNVSANDAVKYAEWLTQSTGASYRLPSEAEWEYVARGGTTTAYPYDEEIVADFHARYGKSTPARTGDRTYQVNRFGLRHVVGNVREWVTDAWSPSYTGAPADGRVRQDGDRARAPVRGGAYSDRKPELRTSARLSLPRDARDSATGFRVVRTFPPAR
jgi:formylglycine-generating enzyme required for sulfatase activity